MAFQSAPGCAVAVINATNGVKAMANVLNFRAVSGAYDLAALTDLAAAVDGVVGSGYLPLMHAGMEYVGTKVRGLENEEDFEVTNIDSAGPGIQSGTALPPNVTFCATLRTVHTGRTARGRFYALPSTNAALLNDHQFETDYANAVVEFLNDLATEALANSWLLVVLSRFVAGAERPEATFNIVTAIEARNRQIDSQRGRLSVGH